MRFVLRNTVTIIICGLVFMSVAVLGQTTGNVGIVFPEVEGWKKGDITVYPKKQLGFSIPYKSSVGGNVTIYVYDSGIKKIADGIEDQNVKNEITKAGKEIESLGEMGYYDNVRKIKDETLTLGGTTGKVQALFTLFGFKVKGTAVDSEIYLFGFQDNFIKIRATRRKGEPGVANQPMVKLLAALDKAFSK